MIETIDDKQELFGIYYEVGIAYQRVERYRESIEPFNKALVLAKENDNRVAEIDTLLSLGISFLHMADEEKAVGYINEVYQLAKEVEYKSVVELVEREFG